MIRILPALALLCSAPLAAQDAAERGDLGDRFLLWELQELELPQEPSDSWIAQLELPATGPVDLLLDRHSVREPGFTVREQQPDGSWREVDPDEPATFRGRVAGFATSRVAASSRFGALRASIRLGDAAESWHVQPLGDFVPGAPARQHVVYSSSWVIDDARAVCGVDEALHRKAPVTPPGAARGSSDQTVTIAFDSDWAWYGNHGFNTTLATDEIEAITNEMGLIYERDVEVCFFISEILLRTSTASDPYYGQTDPGTILGLFVNEWVANQGHIERDVAHIMTGVPNTTGVVGVAYVGVVCSTAWGYGLSLDWGDLFTQTGLTSHEVGHNFNAGHCDGLTDCWIMCGGLGGCSGWLGGFGPDSINAISGYAAGLACLEDGCGVGGPLTLEPPDPGVAGQANQVTITGGTPQEDFELYWGLQWWRTTPLANCPGVDILMGDPHLGLSGSFDERGEFSQSVSVPAGARNLSTTLQVVEPVTCRVSNIEIVFWF